MLSFLKDKSLTDYKVGSAEYFAAQKHLILNRAPLKWCYDGWYAHLLTDARSVPGNGTLLELGSGGSYLKDLEPSVVTSDVVGGVADMVVDGRALPFPDASVRALLLTHVFHHIPEAGKFLQEAARVLVPGGVISMIEVAHTPFARFFFKNFHHEPYRDNLREWAFDQKDSMMDSNQALSWMVFVRDRAKFVAENPSLRVEQFTYLPWLSYLLSGGVTGKCLVPKFMNGAMPAIETMVRPLSGLFALHWHIRVRKVK